MTSKEAKIEILGVRIDNFSVAQIKEKIVDILNEPPKQKFITTLNPEILLKAHRNENYLHILNSADLNICDGFGLKFVSFLRGKKIKNRFAGADLADFLLEISNRKKMQVLIIASKNSLSAPEEIEVAIRQRFSNISIKSEYISHSQDFFKSAIIEEAEMVFVNFGAPTQEKFIYENRAKFFNAKILVGVGGTFDFLTGKIRRAPKFFRVLGLEWLWRLIREPKRFRRIWNAVIVFPVKVFYKD